MLLLSSSRSPSRLPVRDHPAKSCWINSHVLCILSQSLQQKLQNNMKGYYEIPSDTFIIKRVGVGVLKIILIWLISRWTAGGSSCLVISANWVSSRCGSSNCKSNTSKYHVTNQDRSNMSVSKWYTYVRIPVHRLRKLTQINVHVWCFANHTTYGWLAIHGCWDAGILGGEILRA